MDQYEDDSAAHKGVCLFDWTQKLNAVGMKIPIVSPLKDKTQLIRGRDKEGQCEISSMKAEASFFIPDSIFKVEFPKRPLSLTACTKSNEAR